MQTEYKKREYKPRTQQPVSSDRIPPQALDAERTILGSMLIDGTSADIVFELLTDDAFYLESHTKIFTCMRDLASADTPIDIITISNKLRQRGWLEDIGTEAYLGELAENVATSGNIQHYASIIKEKATLRQLISAAADITTACFTDEREAQEVLDAAEHKIFSISESRIKSKVESVGHLLKQTFVEIDNYSKGVFSGIPSGFTELDKLTTGFHGGDLVIVGGRPGMGKTAFCLAVALNAAVRTKHCTAFFSLEMSKSQIMQRMLCSEARVSMHKLRKGMLNRDEHKNLGIAAGPLADSPLFIDDTPAITVLELKAKARRLKAQHNLSLIIIDYLQLMAPSVKAESMQQEISQISRSLKSLAKELNVPVVALSQLSRAVEQRKTTGDKKPQLSDLRESGAIEQDADLVMFVYRPEYYNRDDPTLKGKAEIIVEKQRNGPTDTVQVAFISEFAKFDNLSDRVDPAEEG